MVLMQLILLDLKFIMLLNILYMGDWTCFTEPMLMLEGQFQGSSTEIIYHEENMKIICWNVREAGRQGFYSQVSDLLTHHKHDILMRLKTRVNSNMVLAVIKRNNMSNFMEIPPVGFRGIWSFGKIM